MTTGVFTEAINDKMNDLRRSAHNMYEGLINADIKLVREKYRSVFGGLAEDGLDKRPMAVAMVFQAYPTVSKLWLLGELGPSDIEDRDEALRQQLSEDAQSDREDEERDEMLDDDPGDGGPYTPVRVDTRLLSLEEGKYTLAGQIVGSEDLVISVLHGYASMFSNLVTDDEEDKVLHSRVEITRLPNDNITIRFSVSGDAMALRRVLSERSPKNF